MRSKEITILPTATNTLSSSSQSSSIKCVSPNVVTGSNNSYVVFEAIYYENGNTNGVQNQPNQLVLAKVKNNHINGDAKTNVIMKSDTNVAAPILVTSVSSPLTSVLQLNNTCGTNCGTIVKKPGIILLTQTSLSKLLSASDLNMINNNANTNTNINSNINTVNHAHSHQPDNCNRSKCNITINTTTNPSSVSTQFNNQLQSVLMINSTSTIETTAGVVTLTSTSAPNRDAIVDTARANNQQVNMNVNFLFHRQFPTNLFLASIHRHRCYRIEIYQLHQNQSPNHRSQLKHFRPQCDRKMKIPWMMRQPVMRRRPSMSTVKNMMIPLPMPTISRDSFWHRHQRNWAAPHCKGDWAALLVVMQTVSTLFFSSLHLIYLMDVIQNFLFFHLQINLRL